MSATVPMTPAAGNPPAERRALVAALTVVEGALILAATLLAYFYRQQPMPVTGGPGGPYQGCIAPGSTTAPGGYPPCAPTPNDTAQTVLLVAVICAVVALLVLPAVIGFVSQRWQTALAAPSIPLWLEMLVVIALSPFVQSFNNYPYGSATDLYTTTIVVNMTGPLLSSLLLAVGLGGLGWMTKRAFAR